MSQPNGHSTHVPGSPEVELHRRAQGSPVLLILAALSGGTVGSVGTYGVVRRPRPPCAAAPAATKPECTCPTCPRGERCTASTCPTCVDIAVSRELRLNEVERRIHQMATCGDATLLDAALR